VRHLFQRVAFRQVAAALVAATVLFGCGSGSKKSNATSCRPARAPEYPGTDALLTDADTGGTWCLNQGATLVVQLHVPPEQSDTRWSPVVPSGTGALEPVSNGAVTLPRGITATFLSARSAGVVTLSSMRPDGSRWSATVVVSG
jgi:hypothetical protein